MIVATSPKTISPLQVVNSLTELGRLRHVFWSFYRDVGKPTQEACGLDIRTHEHRHTYVTHLRAPGVNDADLAEIAGRRVQAMLAHYTHADGSEYPKVREIVT